MGARKDCIQQLRPCVELPCWARATRVTTLGQGHARDYVVTCDGHQTAALRFLAAMSLPRHLPGRRRALCVGLKTKTDWVLDDGMGRWWMGKGPRLFLLSVLPT